MGFAAIDEIRHAAERDASGHGRLIHDEIEEDIQCIEEDAEIVEYGFRKFQQLQTDHNMDGRAFTAAKQSCGAGCENWQMSSIVLLSRMDELSDFSKLSAGDAERLRGNHIYEPW